MTTATKMILPVHIKIGGARNITSPVGVPASEETWELTYSYSVTLLGREVTSSLAIYASDRQARRAAKAHIKRIAAHYEV